MAQKFNILIGADFDDKASGAISKMGKTVSKIFGKAGKDTEDFKGELIQLTKTVGKEEDVFSDAFQSILRDMRKSNQLSLGAWKEYLDQRVAYLRRNGQEATKEFEKTYKALQDASERFYTQQKRQQLEANLPTAPAPPKPTGQKMSEMGGLLASQGLAEAGMQVSNVSRALGASLYSTVDAFRSYEQAVQNARTLSQGTATEFAQLEDLTQRLGETTAFTAVQAAEGWETLARNGLSASQVLGGALESSLTLATATGTTISNAADIATDAMLNFGLSAGQMGQAINQIVGATTSAKFGIDEYRMAVAQAAGVAGSVGVEFDDFNTVIAATAGSFGSGGDAGTSFKTFLVSLKGNSKEAKDKMAELGLEFYNSAGQLRSMTDIAGQLQTAFGGLTEAQRNEAAATIFGTDAMRTGLALAKVGAEGFANLGKKVNEQTDANKIAKEKMETLNGAMVELNSAVDALKTSFGAELAPSVKMVAEVIRDLVQKLNEMPPWAKKTVGVVGTLVAGLGALAGITISAAGSIGQLLIGISALTGGMGAGATAAGVLGGALKGLGAFAASAALPLAAVAGAIATVVAAYKGMETLLQGKLEVAGMDAAKLGDFRRHLGATNAAWRGLKDSLEAGADFNLKEAVGAGNAELIENDLKGIKVSYEDIEAAALELGVAVEEADRSQLAFAARLMKHQSTLEGIHQRNLDLMRQQAQMAESQALTALTADMPLAPSHTTAQSTDGFADADLRSDEFAKQMQLELSAQETSLENWRDYWAARVALFSRGGDAEREEFLKAKAQLLRIDEQIKSQEESGEQQRVERFRGFAKSREQIRQDELSKQRQAADTAYQIEMIHIDRSLELGELNKEEATRLKIEAIQQKLQADLTYYQQSEEAAGENADRMRLIRAQAEQQIFKLEQEMKAERERAAREHAEIMIDTFAYEAQKRFELGEISHSQLLQAELEAMQRRQAVRAQYEDLTLSDMAAHQVEVIRKQKEIAENQADELTAGLDRELEGLRGHHGLVLQAYQEKIAAIEDAGLTETETYRELLLERNQVIIDADGALSELTTLIASHEARLGEMRAQGQAETELYDTLMDERNALVAEKENELQAIRAGVFEAVFAGLQEQQQSLFDLEVGHKEQMNEIRREDFDTWLEYHQARLDADREYSKERNRILNTGMAKMIVDTIKQSKLLNAKAAPIFAMIGQSVVDGLDVGADLGSILKNIAMQFINMAQANLLAAIALMFARAIMTFGASLGPDLALKALGFAALEVAKRFVAKMATGGPLDSGLITGPGGPTDDLIPMLNVDQPNARYLVSNREYIVKGASVEDIGPSRMDVINREGMAGVVKVARQASAERGLWHGGPVLRLADGGATSGASRVGLGSVDNSRRSESLSLFIDAPVTINGDAAANPRALENTLLDMLENRLAPRLVERLKEAVA